MSPKDKFFYLYALQDAMQKSVILNIRISQFKILGVALETITEATVLTME